MGLFTDKSKEANSNKNAEVYCFDITMMNGDIFCIIHSLEFDRGIWLEVNNHFAYAVGNEDLWDKKNNVVDRNNFISYDRQIKLICASGKADILINPKAIAYVGEVSIGETSNSELSRARNNR